MSPLSTRDDTARGLSSEPRSGRGNGRIFVASAVVLTWARDGDLKFSQVGARQTASASVFGDGRFYTLSRVIERRSPGAFWMSAAAAARIGCGVGQRAAR